MQFGDGAGRGRGGRVGRRRAHRARRALRAIGAVGFQARLEHLEDGRAEIVTPTCPLRPLVVANPAVAEVDHALWRGLVAAAIEDVRVEDVGCETHDCLEPCSSCRIAVSLPPSTTV